MKYMTSAIALVALWSPGAAADPAGAQAEVLFRQGRDLLKAGKTAEACAAFAESEKLDPAITTLINLASCREKQGEIATAWGLFLDAERQARAGTDATMRQLHDFAADRATKLEPRISKLTVNVPQQSMVDGLEVRRNGERLDAAMWNRALPIDGGTYTVTAKAPGSSVWSTQVAVGAEADTKTVDVPDLRSLPRDVSPEPPATVQHAVVVVPPPASAIESEPSYTLPIVVGASSVAVLGGAVGLELWGEAKYNDAKSSTVQKTRDSFENAANARRYAAEGVAVAGVLGAGAAVWLFFRDRGERQPARAARLELVPTGAGVAVRGSY